MVPPMSRDKFLFIISIVWLVALAGGALLLVVKYVFGI